MHPQTKSGRIASIAATVALAIFALFLAIALTGVLDLDQRDSPIEGLAKAIPLTVMFLAGVVAGVTGLWSLARKGERAVIVYLASAIGMMFVLLLALELLVIE